VLVATGVSYRRLEVPNFSDFERAGIYYAATEMEAKLCRGEDVVVVGGGNSAGQAVVYLAGIGDTEAWRAMGRSPFLLETSLPGVFAAGDVRSGSVKRCASAVGEGAMAVSFVHKHVARPAVVAA
jgi:thioredoxin reductase